MTHRELLVAVWGVGYSDDTQVLRGHVANLRRKIEPPDGPRYIKTDPASGTGSRLSGRRQPTLQQQACTPARPISARAPSTAAARHDPRMDVVAVLLGIVDVRRSVRADLRDRPGYGAAPTSSG